MNDHNRKELIENAHAKIVKELVKSFRDIWQNDPVEVEMNDKSYQLNVYGDNGNILVNIQDDEGEYVDEFKFIFKDK